MIIATLDKKFNNNVELFDVFENGGYIVTTNRNGISYITDTSTSRVSNHFLTHGYKGYKFFSVGKLEKLYKFSNGKVGTMQEHCEWDNVSMNTIKRRAERNKDTHVGNRLNGEEIEMHDLDDVIYKPVEVPVIKQKEVKPKVIKYPYKGENKEYIDYLLESTFKGWRA